MSVAEDNVLCSSNIEYAAVKHPDQHALHLFTGTYVSEDGSSAQWRFHTERCLAFSSRGSHTLDVAILQ